MESDTISYRKKILIGCLVSFIILIIIIIPVVYFTIKNVNDKKNKSHDKLSSSEPSISSLEPSISSLEPSISSLEPSISLLEPSISSSNSPLIPEILKIPEIPKIPEILKIPEIPKIPEILKIPEIPKTPDYILNPITSNGVYGRYIKFFIPDTDLARIDSREIEIYVNDMKLTSEVTNKLVLSSSGDISHPLQNLFDGDLNTYGSAYGDSYVRWISIDLEKTMNITKIILYGSLKKLAQKLFGVTLIIMNEYKIPVYTSIPNTVKNFDYIIYDLPNVTPEVILYT